MNKLSLIPLVLLMACGQVSNAQKSASDSTNYFTMTVNKTMLDQEVIDATDDSFTAGALLFKRGDKYFFALTVDSCGTRVAYNCALLDNVNIAKQDDKIAIIGYWMSGQSNDPTTIIVNTKNNYGLFHHPNSKLVYMGYFKINELQKAK